MPRYTVNHRYAAQTGDKQFGPWQEGDEVELDEADAAWVNADSTDTLSALCVPDPDCVPVAGDATPEPPTEAEPADVDPEPVVEDEEPKSRRGRR